jgi:hypothetical protein
MAWDSPALDEMIGAARQLGSPDFARQVAAEAAPLVDEAIKRTARAGTTPDGKPWAPRKKDGQPALQNVAEQISTNAFGDVVRTTLEGPAVFSHFGAGITQRQVIPDSAVAIPDSISQAVTKAAGRVFERIAGGGR